MTKSVKLVLSNFFFCHYFFIKPSAAEASERVYMRERDNYTAAEALESVYMRERDNYTTEIVLKAA